MKTMHTQAIYALRAAANRGHWGKLATRQYIANRGVPAGLYRLACQLRAVGKTETQH